ncbi:MAG TPA: hypothetical protein VLI39_01745 [Sedimentisphaerales bacterium]|nr:hypothetical protein [Sedimentisphaerales bacterium]
MRIVVSADLGEFGPTDGKLVLYHFSPLYHVQGLIPWLLLPLAFVSLKENRTLHAAWILAPLALLGAVYLAVMNLWDWGSGTTVQFNVLFTIIIVGFSILWLLAERIGNRNRLVAFLLAALLWFGFLVVNLLSRGFHDAAFIVVFGGVSVLSILLAFAIASWLSAKRFRRVRFVAWTGFGLFGSLLTVASTLVFLFYPSGPVVAQLTEVFVASLISSLVHTVCLLPFLVLLWTNRFWRRRFERVTRVPMGAQ